MRRDRRDLDLDTPDAMPSRPPVATCPACADRDPVRRHSHYLALAREKTLAGAVAHIQADLSERLRDLDRIRTSVNDIEHWLRSEIEPYEGKVDATTGEFLPWWEARAQWYAQMRDCYNNLPGQA